MLLAELYMSTDQYQQAQNIYEIALINRDADWARAGLARIYVQQQKWQDAEAVLQSLIDINYMYVEAYEELAHVYLRQEKNQKAEDILTRATLVSPLSLRRQQLLAGVAEKNNHFETAAKAWRQVLRVARYSKHETEENYLRLCSCLTDYCDFANLYKDEKISNEVTKSLLAMRKYYRPSIDCENQALLIEGRLLYGKGNIEKAKEIIDQVDLRYIEKADTFSVHTQLEFAKSLSQVGDSARAQRVLKKLVAQCDDKDILQRADKVLEEPVSDDGKKRIIELNRCGINYFKNQQYELAVNAFAEAKSFFPRNIELNLNLVQALLKLVAVSEDGQAREQWLATAENCLQLIIQIPRDHKKYDNFRRLRAEVEALQSA
jgi:tetratricopeptide (TPR) repeat protein